MKATYQQKKADAAATEATLVYQQRELERQQRLLASGTASQAQYDQSNHAYKIAREQLASKEQDVASTLASLGGDPDIPVAQHPMVQHAAGGARPRRAQPLLHGGPRAENPASSPRSTSSRSATGYRSGHWRRSDRSLFADVDGAGLGRGQFQGDRAHPYAARTNRDGRDRHLSRCRVPGQGAKLEPGNGADLLAAAGGKRDRQLGQSSPAPAGAAQLR